MDTETMACPECGTVNPMIGVVHDTRQYLCRACGQVYYTPDSCLRDPEAGTKPLSRTSPASTEATPRQPSDREASESKTTPGTKERKLEAETRGLSGADRGPSASRQPESRGESDSPEKP